MNGVGTLGDRLDRVLQYSKQYDYAGYSKFDALNSPFLETLFGWSYLTRLCITQLINRSYLHLRPLCGTRKSRNPKGIANFVKAWCNLFLVTGDQAHRAEAEKLARWLLANHSNQDGKFQGLCWGYNFPWQSPGFFAPRRFPNCIVTVFAAEALLHYYRVSGDHEFLAKAEEAARFILNELPVLEENEEIKCIGYVTAKLKWKVININAVTGGFLAKLWKETGKDEYRINAAKMINWVVGKRTDYYAWFYTEPKGSSGIGHDNYHTGGILDGIFDYMENSGDREHMEVYLKGLAFYREHIFTEDGAPKLTSSREYPYDIHGTAQGILSFVKAALYDSENMNFANQLADWGIKNMQDASGHFYYRKHRFFIRKECLMRWNNSWMSWALSELALAKALGAK